MRQVMFLAAAAAIVTSTFTTAFVNGLIFGAGTATSAEVPVQATGANTTSESDGIIQGDVDCDGDVDAVDALKELQHVAAIGFTQTEPCPDVGTLIPAGEPIPGPEGPQGPQGPQGEQGEQGPQGPPGVSDYERVFEQTTGTAPNKSVVAECPPGKVVLGGGGSVSGALPDDVALFESYPLDSTRWHVIAQKITGAFVEWSLTAYAICVNVAE